MINPELDRLARSRYVRLTAWAADGSEVANHFRVVSEGGFLQVLVGLNTRVVAALRATAEASAAPCDLHGGLQGDPVPVSATVLEDPALVDRAEQLLVRRYGLLARASRLSDRIRKRDRYVVVAIDVPEGEPVP